MTIPTQQLPAFKVPVITGMGIVTPFGQNINVFKTALEQGLSAIDFITADENIAPITISAKLRDFDFRQWLEKAEVNDTLKDKALRLGIRAPLGIQTSIISSLEAWQQAFPDSMQVDPHRMGIIVTGNNTTTALSYQHYQDFKNAPTRISPAYAMHFLDTNHLGYISELFNIQGEGFSVGNASASGNGAIIQASRLIQLGIVDCCVVVGVMAELSVMELQALRNLNVLGGTVYAKDPKSACRPFDSQHEGFIPGQASACLILESETHAHSRQAPILGKILGSSIALDANHLTNPNVKGEAYVMREAIARAGIEKKDINYINAHGTSSVLGDEVELQALHEVFGECLNKIWINSTKSITGHCVWSAGIVETIAILLQMNNNFLHPNLNLDNPIDTTCLLVGKSKMDIALHYAINNSFGFGGINTSIVLEKGNNHDKR